MKSVLKALTLFFSLAFVFLTLMVYCLSHARIHLVFITLPLINLSCYIMAGKTTLRHVPETKRLQRTLLGSIAMVVVIVFGYRKYFAWYLR